MEIKYDHTEIKLCNVNEKTTELDVEQAVESVWFVNLSIWWDLESSRREITPRVFQGLYGLGSQRWRDPSPTPNVGLAFQTK